MRSCLLLLLAVCARAGSVEGTVTNTVTGAPVKKATVTLVSPSLRVRYIAGTDDQGQFQFPDVEAAADYVLEARANGFTMPPETRQILKERRPLAVTVQESVKGVAVNLVPLGAINGKITDADGDPVRGVSVQALQYQYRASGRRLDSRADAITDANGLYRIYFLPPGRYLVRAYIHRTPAGPAEPSPHVHNFVPEEGFLTAYYPGSPEAAAGAVVEVKAGADLNGYDLRLARAPAYHVRGRIEGAQANSRVAVAPCSTPSLDFGSALYADVRPDGTFDARGITPGQYCLAVERSGGRLATADAQVSIKNGDVNGIVLAAPARVNLQGAVQMDPSQAERPPRLTVMLADEDTPGLLLGIAQVQDNGAFSLRNVQAGPADLTVAGQPPGDYLKSFRFAERNARGRFEVPRTGGTLTLAIGTDGGQLTGKAQDRDGNPGDHMLVTLAPKGDLAARTDLIRTAPTGDDGSFQMTGLAPGDYDVFAWESLDQDTARSPEFLKLFEATASTVSVQSAGATSVQIKGVPAEDMEAAKWRPRQ
jgi:protocatechuate 3,4-dioxygenase beta subunit